MLEQQESGSSSRINAKYWTIVMIGISIFNIPFSFIPVVGAISLFFGFFGFISCLFTYRIYNKLELNPRLPILAIMLSLLVISLGLRNGYKYKDVLGGLALFGVGTAMIQKEMTTAIKEEVKKEVVKAAKEKLIGQAKAEPQPNAELVFEGAELPVETQLEKKTKGPLDSYFYALVDQLRIRAEPNTVSEVLGHIKFGEQLRYLNEKTGEKDTIKLAGKERSDYWYKVERLLGFEVEGWVYGAALVNATELSTGLYDGTIMKPFNFITVDSLATLIGREVYGNFIFSGLMTFKGDASDATNSNGRFYFIGFSGLDFGPIPGDGEDEELGGVTQDGQLHGKFTERVGRYESWYDLEIEFNEGVCVSYKLVEHAEGDISEALSSNPVDCSFDFIVGELSPVNF